MEYQALQLVSAPLVHPVTLVEAKEHLRVEDAVHDEDTLIASLIAAATEYVSGRNGYTARALIRQSWRAYFDTFTDGMAIPFPPLMSVESITYTDTAGATQTLAASVYAVTRTEPARIRLKAGQCFPATRCDPEAVCVTFTAGYLPTDDDSPSEPASGVPSAIKAAILLVMGDLYQNREAQALVQGADYIANPAVKALLNPYRVDMGL